MGIVHTFVLLAICAVLIQCASTQSQQLSGNEFFLSVDPTRRDLLIKHFLTDALQRHQIYVTPDPRVVDPIAEFGEPPLNFANNLLFWTRSTLGIDYIEIARAIENNLVNTDPVGCSPHDIGCHCCPF